VEARITQKGGVRLWFMLLLRIGGAFLLGWIIHLLFSIFHLYTNKSTILWTPGFKDPRLLYWILGECKNYIMIFLIILGLLSLMYVLKKSGVINRLNSFLEPFLKFLGMSKNVAPLAIIGMTIGLAYGGGLILRETKSHHLTKKDTFLSLSMMGLSHSLIEDTLLLVTIGASLVGILVGRLLFTILIMMLLIQCINRLSQRIFNKYFFLFE
jgi:spore maturation protein SpmB